MVKKLILIILASSYLTACGIQQVDTGHRGIVTSFGDVEMKAYGEGLHTYNPFTKDMVEYKVQQETWEAKNALFTQDNQRVDITFAVTYNPEPEAVPYLFKTYGTEDDLVQKVVRPTVIGTLQKAIGKVQADELNVKKDAIAKQTLEELRAVMAEKKVFIADLQFTDTDFNDEYERAAEAKVIATQEAQKAKNDTVRIEEQARQTVATAKAQAESMRIQSEALSKNKGLVEYELAKKWDGKLPQYMFGSTTPLLDLKSIKQ